MIDENGEKIWKVQEAKLRFSELLKQSFIQPQYILLSNNNECKKAVVMSLQHLEDMQAQKPSFIELMETVPCRIKV
ncbi:type II toxin-antitoxin system prevent-host-death family antitoxin [Candidatus Sneabacter namystus]|uniref:Type II toxin-antitoxin system Phd/YefM family antitoxin n=1 Tax=Candidatus Sneabacter namystus TaxID=2601646 RepID=A0A5C0UIG2_9RICK|nr:type II toxin-antitoxin system prevent-host-death family antitoxin [Candidatus Sneabacter namystus]QEK39898.1 type II toxin-antitoxin system Phd/YefM family antitoxin [Candidatus Sneabacter namystus]